MKILGAGQCGTLLATLLAPQLPRIDLYERGSDPRSGSAAAGRSINLALAARGIRALETAGVMTHVKPLLVPMRGRPVKPAAGMRDSHRFLRFFVTVLAGKSAYLRKARRSWFFAKIFADEPLFRRVSFPPVPTAQTNIDDTLAFFLFFGIVIGSLTTHAPRARGRPLASRSTPWFQLHADFEEPAAAITGNALLRRVHLDLAGSIPSATREFA